MRSDWRKAFLAAFGCVAGVAAFGRGERWINPPQPAPAVSTLTNEARYVEWKWRTDVTDPATGVGNKAVTKEAEALVRELEPKEPWRVVKAKAFQLICDRMSIGVSDLDWFPAFACYNRYDLPLKLIVWRREKAIDAKIHPKEAARIREGNLSGEWSAGKDFCHSVPQWDQVLALGLPGLRRRVAAYGRRTPFYESLEITADASIRLVGRLAAQAEKVAASGGGPRARRQAEALRQLVGRRRREQLVVNMLVAAKVDPADGAKAEAWLGKWLEDRKDSPYVKSFEAWVGSYRELHPASAAFAAEEENLRERLDAVRPAVSRVTVTRK